MQTDVKLIALSVLYDQVVTSLSTHITTSSGDLLRDSAPDGIRFLDASWRRDEIVDAFFRHLLLATGLDRDVAQLPNVETGVLTFSFDADRELRHQQLPWLEWVVQRLHDPLDYASSYMFYVVGNEDLRLRPVNRLTTLTIESEFEHDVDFSPFDTFASLLDEHLYGEEINDRSVPQLAHLLLAHSGGEE